jgi:hypothetical protein
MRETLRAMAYVHVRTLLSQAKLGNPRHTPSATSANVSFASTGSRWVAIKKPRISEP